MVLGVVAAAVGGDVGVVGAAAVVVNPLIPTGQDIDGQF